jgi:hypothetical protein
MMKSMLIFSTTPLFASLKANELTTPLVVTSDFGLLRLRKEGYEETDLVQWAKADLPRLARGMLSSKAF